MTSVLVVDDSAVDRSLVGGLLRKNPDLTVDYAVNGAEALTKIEQDQPELVISDLIMPKLDGLELVAAVRSKFPLVPVILMTSKGSEEIAVQALQAGTPATSPSGGWPPNWSPPSTTCWPPPPPSAAIAG